MGERQRRRQRVRCVHVSQIAVKKYIFDTLSIEELIPPVSHYHHREEIVGKFEIIKVLTVNKC